mmetsp:Transcript_26436/g.30563  ORF Transcript_26436/g.30563 Transcript_26436/m.30563 type:complete len:270 (-) Transcript_26436:301-1110(-)
MLVTSTAGFVLGAMGGYTRNMRYGMNKIEWRASSKIPSNEQEWLEQYEEFKKYPEYTIRGKEVDLTTFKQTFWICTVGKFLGAGGSLIFGVPMIYFWARGYFKAPMKRFCLAYTALYATVGFQGMYMDNNRPGAIDEETGEKLNVAKDPYQRALHFGLIYTLYGLGVWQTLNLLRKCPDTVKSLERYFGRQVLRKHIFITAHSLYLFLLATGCLMSGTGAGRSITTFPKVNDKWLLTKEDFDSEASVIENLLNRKVLHYTHRSLGMTMF